jgi:carboxypeptidase family protein
MIIAGAVSDPSGRPVAGASVLIASAPAPVPDIAGLTGDDGRFSITVPVPGDYRLVVRNEVDQVDVTVHVADHETQVAVALPG